MSIFHLSLLRKPISFSSLAALGLVENNAPNIVAAMLVSPLMGPVMSVTFGTMIADKELVVNIYTINKGKEFDVSYHRGWFIVSEIWFYCLLCRAIDLTSLRFHLWSDPGHHRDALGLWRFPHRRDEGTVNLKI